MNFGVLPCMETPMWWPRFRRASREERVRAVRGQESAVNFSGGIKKAGSEYNLGPVLDKGTTHWRFH